ncbi:hypothetical protein HW561_03150 [Rhodobacteraceae bacterium B1Z28]|uniref:Secreted protein n=1 Tax=Ruegeria haliotis TaxID=2747601 RepID=A0ABX2PL79_9RHOB|nr:hypothetical protein [Ruegeria haliotis]NVO54783.1 hypothetical protein [Ruegeria haliotis]
MKPILTCATLAVFALGIPATADAARNGFRSEPINSTDFEVIPRTQQFTDGYWCAASDFARRKLGADWKQRIYVLRGYGPSVTTGRRTAVQFSLKQPAGGPPPQTGIVTSSFVPGSSLTVSAANGRCNVRPFRDN